MTCQQLPQQPLPAIILPNGAGHMPGTSHTGTQDHPPSLTCTVWGPLCVPQGTHSPLLGSWGNHGRHKQKKPQISPLRTQKQAAVLCSWRRSRGPCCSHRGREEHLGVPAARAPAAGTRLPLAEPGPRCLRLHPWALQPCRCPPACSAMAPRPLQPGCSASPKPNCQQLT